MRACSDTQAGWLTLAKRDNSSTLRTEAQCREKSLDVKGIVTLRQ